MKQSPVVDRVNGTPVLVAVGPDGKSFRVFVSRIDGKDAEFFLKGESEGGAIPTQKPKRSRKPRGRAIRSNQAGSACRFRLWFRRTRRRTACNRHEPRRAPRQALDPARTLLAGVRVFQGCAMSGPAQGSASIASPP